MQRKLTLKSTYSHEWCDCRVCWIFFRDNTFPCSCFISLPWYRFRLMNICILIANIKFASSKFNVSLLTSFHTYQQARTIDCNSPNLTLTHVEYCCPELTPSAILLCSFIQIFITYVFPQLIKLLLYTETSCHIWTYNVRNHVPNTRTANVETHTHPPTTNSWTGAPTIPWTKYLNRILTF